MTADMLTPEQVADYLQVTTATVYRLIRQQRLAATRIGRIYRIPKEDLETYLRAHSSRAAVREALFRRVMEIGERQGDVDGDALLEELERFDDARLRSASPWPGR